MRPPPECKPPPKPPDPFRFNWKPPTIPIFIGASTRRSTKPTLLDCGAEGHIVTSHEHLDPATVRESDMTTEAFNGGSAPITHVGDHVSGLLPTCHVVPRSAFNLVATGKYCDTTGCAIILTSRLALQLDNLDFDELADADDPKQYLLECLNRQSLPDVPPITCKVIGVRTGKHSLYHTDLLCSLPAGKAKSIATHAVTTTRVRFTTPRHVPQQQPPHTAEKDTNPTTPPQQPTMRRIVWGDVLKQRVVNPCTAPSVPVDSPIRVNDALTSSLIRLHNPWHNTSVQFTLRPTLYTNTASVPPQHPTHQNPKARPPPEPPPLSHRGQTDSEPAWTSSTTTEQALMELRRIHCAMGHPNNDVLLQALRTSPEPKLRALVKYVKLMDPCNVCPAGTQKAKPHPKTASSRATRYLDRLIMDLSGRQPVASLGGNYYFFIIVDDYSRFKWVYFLKSPSQVPAIFDNFLRTVVRQGTFDAAGNVRSVRFVRTDNGPDFNSNSFRQVLQLHSITIEPSPPDASNQRGVAERGIGVTSEITRSSLLWSCAPFTFWAEAVGHSVTTSNNLPNSSNPGKRSPFQMVNPDKQPQLSLLHPFGCLSFTHIPTNHREAKLNPASSIGFLAGYGLTPDGSINGYRVMSFNTKRFTTKFNVKTNPHVPALRHILSIMTTSPQQLLIGRKVIKRFSDGDYTGTVVKHSTEDNITLYDIAYDDGDSEQMDIIDVLKHIAPKQTDSTAHTPAMHQRLRMAAPSDRAKISNSFDHSTRPSAATKPNKVRITRPTSKTLLRKSGRNKKPPNRLTSKALGTNADSHSLPLLTKTHGKNKANQAMLAQSSASVAWKRRYHGRASTVSANISTCSRQLRPNAEINGILLHRFSAVSPPVPRIPARVVPNPISFDDAMFGIWGPHWRPAYQKEIDSLFKYGVWELQPLPPGAMQLDCKIVCKVKPDGRDPPGIDKFKIRYCGKGYLQKKGIHFHNTYAPVAASLTVRLIVSIATELNWPLHGMDVSNAYLNALLEPGVVLFVRPPPTIFVPKGYGLRLLKALYGTMQGGNRWAHHKHLKLTGIKMIRNPADPSLYHRHDEHGIVVMDIIVDDFKITGWPPSAVARLKAQLCSIWDMTDLGPLRYFANVEITRDRSRGLTTLKQTQYVHDMLARYGLQDCYPKHTPCSKSIYDQRLLEPVKPYESPSDDNYASQVGSLGYLRFTRPDLCVSLGVASQFTKLGRHGPAHFRALRNIMRNVSFTCDFGLLFSSSGKSATDPWDVAGYVDSDWANCKATRRSRTGWLIRLNGDLICFGSKLQSSVALSSAEAEYMALSTIVRMLLWLINILTAIPGQFIRRPIPIYEDNKPCINLADNHAASKYTRHIGIAHHFLRQHCYGGDRTFSLIWRQSNLQPANGMTKPLAKTPFIEFRDEVVSDIIL